MLQIGKYRMDEFVNCLRENPEFMDRIMTLYNNFDIQVLKQFFETLDLSTVFSHTALTHRRYVENKLEIDRLTADPDTYPQEISNKDYLNDQYTKRIYNKAAEIYDGVWAGVWPYEMRNEVADWLELKPGDRILEVGVGTGTNLESFPDFCEVTGIDYCQKMLDMAGEKAKRLPNKKVILELMDATDIAFPDNSFDKVLSFYTLCSSRDPLKVLKEITRVCQPGGTIVIFDVIKSEIEEVAVLQYLFRPIARQMGAIYLEFCPPYNTTYDSFLNIFALLKRTDIQVNKVKTSDPYKTVNLIQCINGKSR
jgi:phosphatidylethanolamine/phosphatidyl-N-methylethanolamine N-methyltransferase